METVIGKKMKFRARDPLSALTHFIGFLAVIPPVICLLERSETTAQVVFNTTSCDIGIVSQYVCHFKGFLNFFKKNLRHSMKYYIMKNMNIFEIEVRTHEHI